MRTSMSRNVKIGIALIVLGVIFLLHNLSIVRIEHWWPIILILGGLVFFLVWYADRKQTGLLLPAAILIVIGCQLWFIHADWPIYVLAPALGFWLMYFLGEKDVGLLVPAFILTLVALVFWFEGSVLEIIWPVVFILVGIALLIWRRPWPSQSVEEETKELGTLPSEGEGAGQA